MKRLVLAAVAYSTTGIGVYHTFLGDFNPYGLLILLIGLLGILYDCFDKKLDAE